MNTTRTGTTILSLTLTVAFIVGCSTDKSGHADTLIAFTTVVPHRFFVQHIGGERVEAHALIGPDQDAHTYSPTPSQIADVARAQIFFRTGVEIEKGIIPKLERTSPAMRVVDLRERVPLREIEHDATGNHMASADATHDTHAPHDEAHHASHVHSGKDPHIWLSPILAKTQALSIRDALIAVDSAGADTYKRNCADLLVALDSLDADSWPPSKVRTCLSSTRLLDTSRTSTG